jgi:isoleucyl-tRNA synthetase
MTDARDYSETLFLPRTDFPMRAGLPQREPEILDRWQRLDLYGRLRAAAKGRVRFILHDGPPYANGNIHVGTALNKILKDVVVRAQQMQGFDSNYVPGWDCHGLPIEWKVEEEYRAKGKNKDAVPIAEFRRECRGFAEHWIDVQRREFQRLGVVGDWANPYTTMSFAAEAQIARELMKFAMNGTLYRGSKPVMWSVVEKTALAEAEVEYEDYTSDMIWAKFPVWGATPETFERTRHLAGAAVVIWTTTPWTIPGNRAISFSAKIPYALYEVVDVPDGNWARRGDRLIVATRLADEVMKAARVTAYEKRADVPAADLAGVATSHPLAGFDPGYRFAVPLLEGDHVTDDAGTGFVHTAPGHGREDFDVWTKHEAILATRGVDTRIPFTVDEDGFLTSDAPGLTGKRVITDKGGKGDANEAVIQALVGQDMLIGRGRLKHQYPHSWRSKKPVIFRNTPQWFISMGDDVGEKGLRATALRAIDATRFVPLSGQNRLRGMVEQRPDWVISRQRAWGVPITVFRNIDTTSKSFGDVVPSAKYQWSGELIRRIGDAFEAEGADAWYRPGAREKFLGGLVDDPADWEQVTDILDVWFDSGSTHTFTLEARDDLKVRRRHQGGPDTVIYLEGSDQHRGWFQSSLLESCGTRGVAPFDIVLTHGFAVDEAGRKMSKSLGNTVEPQDVIRQAGADILRLWSCSSDYTDELRIGPEILKTNVDVYRKLRNTIRWMLGNLAHFTSADRVPADAMPELERLMLHRLTELDEQVRQAYAEFDYKRIFAVVNAFMTVDLSAFYFDVRKDALYCDPISSITRKACLTVIDQLFRASVTWLAPILCFTAEEAWLAYAPSADGSVHLELFGDIPKAWRDDALAEKWRKVRLVRRVVTGALETERAAKRIGASLEAAPVIHVADPELRAALAGVDIAEVAITSAATVVEGEGPKDAFRLDDVRGVAVEPALAHGRKCARSWKILPTVGSDPDYPDVSPRDAQALREFDARRRAAS